MSAGLLALWCGLIVGSIDNVLRPRLVGSDARMSDLMILISTLGGISLFGPVGFIVRPIVAGRFRHALGHVRSRLRRIVAPRSPMRYSDPLKKACSDRRPLPTSLRTRAMGSARIEPSQKRPDASTTAAIRLRSVSLKPPAFAPGNVCS